MSLCRSLIPLVALTSFALTSSLPQAAAVETAIPGLPLPEAMGRDVIAMAMINDPQWLTDQADRLVSAAGVRHEEWAELMDELLFFSGSRSGLDLERPAMVAWRSGSSPLVAMIPVGDREDFMREFGIARHSDRLMVRINEADGTIVLGHNTLNGLFEYRLLLSEGYAYLARTAAECREMAATQLSYNEQAPPFHMVIRGEGLAGFLGTFIRDPASLIGGLGSPRARVLSLPAMMAMNWQDLLQQVDHLSLTVSDNGDDVARIAVGVTGRAETRLSAWIGRQTNASSRLVEAVRTGSDIAVVHGAIRWQGELESWGRHLLQTANQEGRNLSPEDIQAVRDLYRLWDRQGAFAVAIGMRLRPNGRLDPAIRQVVEQPGAADILTYQRRADGLFGEESVSEEGAFGAFDGRVSWQGQITPAAPEVSEDDADSDEPMMAPVAWNRVQIATATHMVEVAETSADEATVGARTVLVGLEENAALEGASGVIAARLHIDRLLELLAAEPPADVPDAGDLAVDLTVRVGSQRELIAQVDVPMPALVQLLAEAAPWFEPEIEP